MHLKHLLKMLSVTYHTSSPRILFTRHLRKSKLYVREMIKITEALAPCILWVKELDKYNIQLEFVGTFITWLSEKISPTFIVTTANNF
jgi:hypothetical protein